MNKTTWISIGIFLAVLAAGVYLLSNQQTQTSGPTATQEGTTLEVPASPNSDVEEMVVEEDGDEDAEVRSITVSGTEFSFDPGSINLEAGETVEVVFVNDGTTSHDFVIDELGVETEVLSPGESQTVNITAEETGTYDFYCSVNGHRSFGMEGEVTVE